MEKINKFLNVCPYCLMKIQSKTSFCLLNIEPNFSNTVEDYNFKEYIKITCPNCLKSFTFVECIECFRKIYLKNERILKDSNLLINCPYYNCNANFFIKNCIKCNSINKQLISKFEDFQYSKIECNKLTCLSSYYIFECAYMCGGRIITNYSNEGNKIFCNNSNICTNSFQQIYCIDCNFRLVWKNPMKIYIEGQKIKCQNSSCKSIFNRVSCPLCNYAIIFPKGGFEFGLILECIKPSCAYMFSQVFCPKCLNIIISSENTEGKIINCENCYTNFTIINCLYCKNVNLWEGTAYIPGQLIKCIICRKKFNKVLCPYCNGIIPFFKADFEFGKVYECIYYTCRHQFSIVLCAGCKVVNFIKYSEKINKQESNNSINTNLTSSYQIENDFINPNKNSNSTNNNILFKKIKCGSCETKFFNITCPFCKRLILDLVENNKNKFNNEDNFFSSSPQIIKCPYEACNKLFSICKCIKCEFFYFIQDTSDYRKIEQKMCDDCINSYYNLYITSNLIYHSFIFKMKETIDKYLCKLNKVKNTTENFKSFCGVEFIQGIPFYFDSPELHNLDTILSMENILIDNKMIYQEISGEDDNFNIFNSKGNDNINTYIEDEEKNKCVVCFENTKESVFVPCGHKVCCFNCAKSIFENIKTCCMCNADIERVIEKIFE